MLPAGRTIAAILCMASTQTLASQDRMQDASRILVAHNMEREKAGVRPLRWSTALENEARNWALQLSRSNAFEHSSYEDRDDAGENLWMGTRNGWTVESMVSSWSREARIFKHGTFPYVSRTGNWSDVGHYTQMIWRDTRELGCAIATNAYNDILVCRYRPAGNVMGQSPN